MQLPSKSKGHKSRSEDSTQKQRHRAIANARERDRTESVNYAFTLLRRLLPTEPANRKLSKIEILRLASSYIQHLDNVRTAIFNGESHDGICARIGLQNISPDTVISGQNVKTLCTFCITASKSKPNNSPPQTTVSTYEDVSYLENNLEDGIKPNIQTNANMQQVSDEMNHSESFIQNFDNNFLFISNDPSINNEDKNANYENFDINISHESNDNNSAINYVENCSLMDDFYSNNNASTDDNILSWFIFD